MKRFVFPSFAKIAIAVWIAGPAHGYEQMETDGGLPVSFPETSCFQYSLSESGSDDFSFDELARIARWSFDVWEEPMCSYFFFEETSPSANEFVGFNLDEKNTNLLIFRESDKTWNWGSSEIAMTSVTYDANTGKILDVDIEFNGVNYQFANQDDYSLPSELVDLKNTLVHEIGHTIGLAHNGLNAANTMFPNGVPGETRKRTLETDDIDGLCDIYPIENNPEVCKEPYCGLGIDPNDLDCELEETGNGCGCILPNKPELPASFIQILAQLLKFPL